MYYVLPVAGTDWYKLNIEQFIACWPTDILEISDILYVDERHGVLKCYFCLMHVAHIGQ
jgi:hypothetical protein